MDHMLLGESARIRQQELLELAGVVRRRREVRFPVLIAAMWWARRAEPRVRTATARIASLLKRAATQSRNAQVPRFLPPVRVALWVRPQLKPGCSARR